MDFTFIRPTAGSGSALLGLSILIGGGVVLVVAALGR